VRRYLISRLSSLGDVVCTLPVAAALKSQPDVHVTWVVDPRFAGLVECCTHVDECIVWKPTMSWKGVPTFDSEFTAALDMQGLLKSALPVAKCRAERKVGYHWQREGARFFSQRVLPDPSSTHIVDQYVDVARALGVEVDTAQFGMEPRNEDLAKVKDLLATNGITDRFVLMNAGAGWTTKRWPARHFAKLIDECAALGWQTALLGGRAEADLAAAAEVCASAKNPPANLLGKTSVRELVALVSLSSAHVGGDTGSTHLAAALGVPAVGLYSITRPQRSCPYGQIDRCHYDPDGLSRIDVESVFRTVEEAMSA